MLNPIKIIKKTEWERCTDKEHYLDKARLVYITRQWSLKDKPNLTDIRLISVNDIDKYIKKHRS